MQREGDLSDWLYHSPYDTVDTEMDGVDTDLVKKIFIERYRMLNYISSDIYNQIGVELSKKFFYKAKCSADIYSKQFAGASFSV